MFTIQVQVKVPSPFYGSLDSLFFSHIDTKLRSVRKIKDETFHALFLPLEVKTPIDTFRGVTKKGSLG